MYKYLFQSVLSMLPGISSEVELLDHGVLRFLSAGDGENVQMLRGQFGLYMDQPELYVNQGALSNPYSSSTLTPGVKKIYFEDKDE